MKRLFSLGVFLLWCTTVAIPQTAVVKRNVNPRSDASTSSEKIETLTPGTQLQLLEPDQTDGFYHVSAPDGQEGWVWGRNVEVNLNPTPTPTPASPPAPTPSPTPSPAGDLFSRLMNCRKAAVPQPLIENGNEVCGPTGDAANNTAIALNTNKNRTDLPGDSDYIDIGWSDPENLPSDRVNDFVGARVRVDVRSHVCGHFVRAFIPDVRACGDWLAYHPRRTARR